MNELVQGAGMGGGAPAASREQLEAQYASQLEQLQGMGFTNVAENLAGMFLFSTWGVVHIGCNGS